MAEFDILTFVAGEKKNPTQGQGQMLAEAKKYLFFTCYRTRTYTVDMSLTKAEQHISTNVLLLQEPALLDRNIRLLSGKCGITGSSCSLNVSLI